MTTTTPTRDAEATRHAILRAALDLFAEEGFEAVGVRSIGARAGVDYSLISRYFGGKDELFVEVIKSGSVNWQRRWGDRESFAERVTDDVLAAPNGGRVLRDLLVLMRSAGSDKAKRLIDEALGHQGFRDLEAWIGGEDADVRARLLMGFLAGMAITRDLNSKFDLSHERAVVMREQLRSAVAAFLMPAT